MIWKKKQFWGTVAAIVLLAYCFKDISFEEIQQLSERMNLFYAIPAVFCTFLYIVLRSLRWRLFLSPQKKLSLNRSIGLYSAGQILNIVMPVLTGQVGRMFLFSRKEGIKKTIIFSTIVLEVLFDAVSLIVVLLLASLAFVFPSGYRFLGLMISGFTIAAVVALYLLLHFQKGVDDFSRRCFRGRWPGIYISIKKFIRSFVTGIQQIRSTQHLFGSMLYSMAGWVVHMLVVYFLFKSFGMELPFATAALVMAVNTIALMIPITPGNAGTFEVAVSSTIAAFSVNRSDAVLFALALHILDLLPIIIFGLMFVHHEKLSLRKIRSEHGDEKIFDQISEEGVLVEQEDRP